MAQKAIVGEKVGMTQVWGDDQRIIPVTVLRVEPARVVQVKTGERDGYSALQVTYGAKDAKKLTKAQAGHFTKANVTAGRRLVELPRRAEPFGLDPTGQAALRVDRQGRVEGPDRVVGPLQGVIHE